MWTPTGKEGEPGRDVPSPTISVFVTKDPQIQRIRPHPDSLSSTTHSHPSTERGKEREYLSECEPEG